MELVRKMCKEVNSLCIYIWYIIDVVIVNLKYYINIFNKNLNIFF